MILRPARDRGELLPGRPQRAGDVGRAEAAQREHRVDHGLVRLRRRPATSRRSRPCRTTARSSRPAPATTRPTRRPPRWRAARRPSSRCGRRAGRSPCPASTTPGSAGRPDRRRRPPTRGRRPPHRGWRRRRGRHRRAGSAACAVGPTPRGLDGPRSGEVEEQLGGEAPGQLAQLLVGRPGEVGEQRQRLVGVVLERARRGPARRSRRPRARSRRSASLRARSRRDVVRFAALGDLLVGLVALLGVRGRGLQREVVAPVGAPAFPWSPDPSCTVANTVPTARG